MPFARLGIVFYAFGILVITFITLWIALFLAEPKVMGMLESVQEEEISIGVVRWTFASSGDLRNAFWPSAAVTLGLLILSCFSRLSLPAQTAIRVAAAVLSLGLLVLNGVLYAAILMAPHELHFAHEHRNRTFVRVLEEFTLREAAENRWTEVQERMAAERLQSADQISRAARTSRVNQIARAIRDSNSPELQKRFLATLSMFRDDLPRSKQDEEIVLTAARKHAGQDFSTSKDFFAWLDQNGTTNGWDPVPLYILSAESRAKAPSSKQPIPAAQP